MHLVGTRHASCGWSACAASTDPKAPPEAGINEANRGALAPQGASAIKKVLNAARICRFDLLRSINNLAREITKRSKKKDVRLHDLMAFVHQSKLATLWSALPGDCLQ